MNSWSARNLTLLGKTAILKSLVVSQIAYFLSSLPSPTGVIKEINCLFYDFLWDSKGDKIKRTEMINEYNKGRLKMTQGPEEMCLSLEHQNPSKTSGKMGYFYRVTVSLHIL